MVATSVAVQLNTPHSKVQVLAYAPGLLNSRIINAISRPGQGQGGSCGSPASTNVASVSPNFINATHSYIMAKTFRPTVLMAMEPVKHTGTGNLGGCVEFRLKHNCDYINDSYVTFNLPEVSCNAADLPDIIVRAADPDIRQTNGGPWNFGTGNAATATELSRVLVRNGFNYDSTAPEETLIVSDDGTEYYIRSSTNGVGSVGGISYTYVNEHGQFIAGPDGRNAAPNENGYGDPANAGLPRVQRANWVRATDLPGLKIITNARFVVEQSVVDEYTSSKPLLMRQTRMLHNSDRTLFDELIGQEVVRERVGSRVSNSGQHGAGLGEGLSALDTFREYNQYANGLQTPKATQPATQVFVPLFFQHTMKRCDSFPAALTSDADVCYQFDTTRLSELYYAVAGNTFIEERVELYTSTTSATPTAAEQAGSIDNPRIINTRHIPVFIPNSNPVVESNYNPNASMISMFLYLTDALHYCLIGRIVFEMIRLYKDSLFSIKDNDSATTELNYKFPIEFMQLRDIPNANTTETQFNVATDWHKLGHQVNTPVHKYVSVKHRDFDGTVNDYYIHKVQSEYTMYRQSEPVIRTLGVNIHDVEYYPVQDRVYYDTWQPYVYYNGLWHYNDEEVRPLFINFSQKPGSELLFGTAGVTKNRKIDLSYTAVTTPSRFTVPDGFSDVSEPVSSFIKTNVLVTACTLNFILVADGVANQRFA